MFAITYKGIFRENREVFSTYLLAEIGHDTMQKIKEYVPNHDQHMFDGYTGRYETAIVRYFMKHEMPLLFQWLTEMKIPHGGIVSPMESVWYVYDLKLLLAYHSQEDLAFRL